MSELATRGVSAAKWGVALTVARIALQVVAQAVIARILGPEVYGVFGMAMVAFMFSMFLCEFGFGMFILQRPTLSAHDIRFVVTWQLMFGLLAAAILLSCAPAVASYFDEPRVEPVVRWMAIASLITSASATSLHLLERDLDFRAIGLVELGSYAVGYLLVGVPLALAGVGVMTLVIAWLSQAGVKLVALGMLRPHSWRPVLKHPDAREVFGLGRNVLLTTWVNWFMGNLDRVIVGRFLGSHQIGIYNAAINLSNTASLALMSPLQSVFLASGARARQEPERLRQAYLQIFATIWVLAAPAFVLLSMLSEEIIAILYGSKWVGAGDVLRPLLIGAPAWLLWGMSTPVLWNTGRGYLEWLLQLPVLVVCAGALYYWVDSGVAAVAWVIAGTLFMRALVFAAAASRAVQIGVTQFLPHVARGLALCSIVVIGACVGGFLAVGSEWLLLSAVLKSAVPIALLALLVGFNPTVLGEQATAMVIRLAPSLARWMRAAQAQT